MNPPQGKVFLFCLLAQFMALPGHAGQIWKHVDAQGVLHFSSEPEHSSSAPVLSDLPVGDKGSRSRQHEAPGEFSTEQAHKILDNVSRSAPYKRSQTVLNHAAATHGLDYALLKAIVIAESGFNEKAVSPKGAVGLMQIMPATATRYGVKSANGQTVQSQLTDPSINVAIGSRYLADLIRFFPGRLDLVLAAYNAGENAVIRAGKKIPNYRETQHYVGKVLKLYDAQRDIPNSKRSPS